MDEKTYNDIVKKFSEGWKIAADRVFQPISGGVRHVGVAGERVEVITKYTPKEYANLYYKTVAKDVYYKVPEKGPKPMKLPSLDSLFEAHENIPTSNKLNWIECSEHSTYGMNHNKCLGCDIEKKEKMKMTKMKPLHDDNLVLSNAFKMVSKPMEKKLFSLMATLKIYGAEAVISGGCFRNWMAGKNEKDIDIFVVKPKYKSEEEIVDLLEDLESLNLTRISRKSSEYDEEFFVYEGLLSGILSDNVEREIKVQLIFLREFDSPKAFIETFDFDINKGFAEVVVGCDSLKTYPISGHTEVSHDETCLRWNVSVEPVAREIANKTLTLNYSTIQQYEWRTKRLVIRCGMIQEMFPNNKIVII